MLLTFPTTTNLATSAQPARRLRINHLIVQVAGTPAANLCATSSLATWQTQLLSTIELNPLQRDLKLFVFPAGQPASPNYSIGKNQRGKEYSAKTIKISSTRPGRAGNSIGKDN